MAATGSLNSAVIGLDVGSTGIRGGLVDKEGVIRVTEYRKLPRQQPEPGASEYDPEEIWKLSRDIVEVIYKKSGALAPAGLGISVQRSTFCLWERSTGVPVTPFYSWADVRSISTSDKMNKSLVWHLLKAAAGAAAFFTRSVFLKAVSMLTFTPVLSACRLRWVFDRYPELYERSRKGELVFGTIDTWLLYKFTNGEVTATDTSCAAATSLYNHFSFSWNSLFCSLFNIPMSVFPRVQDTASFFGTARLPGGIELPIGALSGDQMASLYANGSHERGEVKISLGSGGFVTVCMGRKPGLSKRGLFPLLAWTVRGEHTYMLEGQVGAVGTVIDWLDSGLGLAATPAELDRLAEDCGESGGVTVLPTPHGIGYPYFFSGLKSAVFGLNLRTKRGEVAYALYEGLSMAIRIILEGIQKDTGVSVTAIKVDGGVSRSIPLMQILANVTGVRVLAAKEPEMTTVGAALLAAEGLGIEGFFDMKGLDQGSENERYYRVFAPAEDEAYRCELKSRWLEALHAAGRA